MECRVFTTILYADNEIIIIEIYGHEMCELLPHSQISIIS